jgi:hypothetical protein
MGGMDQERRSRFHVALLIAAVIVLLPALYVLSLGPFAWLLSHGYIDSDATWGQILHFIYRPIVWISAVCPPFREFAKWYVRVCSGA